MNGNQLSPLTRLLVSLSVVVGILVAGLTHSSFLSSAKAQTDSEPVFVIIGNSVPVLQGEVVGRLISAKGVLIDGVPTDFLFDERIEILDSAIVSDIPMALDGVGISGVVAPKTEVVVVGTLQDPPPYGVGISGVVAPKTEVVVSSDSGVEVTGGQLLGDNISIVDGVLRGENLRVVGATVSGAGLCVANVSVTVPGS